MSFSHTKYLPTTFLGWGNLLMFISAVGWNFVDNDQQAQNFTEGADDGYYLALSSIYMLAALCDLGFLWDYMTGNLIEKWTQRILLLASVLNVVAGFETVLGCYLRYAYLDNLKFSYLSWSYTLDFITSILWAMDALLFLIGYRLLDGRDASGKVVWCPTMNFTLLADLFSVFCCVLYAFEGFLFYEVYVILNADQTTEMDPDSNPLQASMYDWAVNIGNQADFAFLTSCVLLCIDNLNSVRYGEPVVLPQVTRRESMAQAKTRKESIRVSFAGRPSFLGQSFLASINAADYSKL